MACAEPARQERSQNEMALLVVAGNTVDSVWRRVWIRLFLCGSLVTSTQLGVRIGHRCVYLYLPLLVEIKRITRGIEGCFWGKGPCSHALRASEDG